MWLRRRPWRPRRRKQYHQRYKDPAEWVTGDELMTGPQRSYLDTLAREAGEALPANLTKAQASEQIDRLQSAMRRCSRRDE
ncbi:DUF3072 domain-containing protein [Rathayibacter toxicus]|uniref:DUF3072 domain-containing protein n=1 Tax=Rathayibacter toxicus TaxID=145458 RepID=A0A0U1PUS4_9MICO|nr:DUF3072 domain-containing protein [Rathayibacter toxicus]ALS56911.1 hypothetical protein APU90_03300 [Rathayibacter toxicus]KKM46254.1 hypothetical protein VT73_04195 [Rathayibacter toxicus]